MSTDPALHGPGTDEYQRATQPHNSSGREEPACVAVPTTAAQVAAVVREAGRRGLRVLPQATGHGAGGVVGDDVLLVDTSGLTDLVVDPDARTASVGAGLTWGEVNAKAEEHGLLGLAGSAPSVSVSGFTFGGGLGWLTRPHGMASSALRSVEYVDGAGRVRTAAEDAPDEIDRRALFAFRGGGGVGVATRLVLDLVEVPDLHAGYLLWPGSALDAVVSAWSGAVSAVGEDVGTSISVIHAPPAPPFPESLQGRPVVHLAVAASTGPDGAAPLLDPVRAAATLTVDTWGPADAATLSQIHLDPPVATPALGVARWLGEDTPQHAAAILSMVAPDDSPLAMAEIRSLDNGAPARPGATTQLPGPYVVHAVGALQDASDRDGIEAAFGRVREAAAPVDLGRSLGSWVEGATSVPDALTPEVRREVSDIADAVDPDGVIVRSRFVS